jgi:hypothetical protein
MCSRFCTPSNLGAVLGWVDAGLHTATLYLAGVEEANLFACIVAAEVDGRGHQFSGRPGRHDPGCE